MTMMKHAHVGKVEPAAPILQLSGWWRETVAIEQELDYPNSADWSRAAWDDLIARLVLEPSRALYRELRDCVGLWLAMRHRAEPHLQTLLDAFVATAWREGLSLEDHAVLVAFRLRRRLEASRCLR
jgi:hypothetical protein